MMDESEVENSVSQNIPTIVQVTISQKKAEGKLFKETKRPLF